MVKVCPELKTQGSCTDSSCQYRHDIYVCKECGVICDSTSIFQDHLQSKRHRRKVIKLTAIHYCASCNVDVTGQVAWTEHRSLHRHYANAELQSGPSTVNLGNGVLENGYCALCGTAVAVGKWSKHLQKAGHLNKEKYAAFKTVLEEAERNKHEVVVSDNMDFGIVTPADARRGVNIKFTLQTNVPTSRIKIDSAKFFSPKTSRSFSVGIAGNALIFGRPTVGRAQFQSSHSGRHEDRVEIVFEDLILGHRFAIVRSVRAIVGSIADHESLKPAAPFVNKQRIAREPETEIFEGVPPPALKAIPYVVKLAQSEIPRKLSTVLSTGSTSDIIGRVRRMFFPSGWDINTYSRHFKHLIWTEEYKMENDLEVYDIPDATLTKHGLCYRLDVPGLAENRPSVLMGDQILVHKHGSVAGQWFEGRVHSICQLSVDLRFHASFSWSANHRYNVRFKLNRHPMRRQHQGLDIVFTQDRLLLPLRKNLQPFDSATPSIKVFNKLIAKNQPQLQAVNSVVRQKPGSVPFVIFGPPGTGKTVTMVEAIRQILVNQPHARVLACAPSNSAADLIASRLIALGNDALFRFYAPSRHKDQVPAELRSFTTTNGNGHFTIPPMARLTTFRVIVTTCISASFAYGVGLPRGHFSHLFFDEAGQATEPEVMIAIRTIADNSTNVILSGDPKQLGPIIHSSVARHFGLETSYLERLMNYEIYKEKNGPGNTVVKLIKNFRSHNTILKFPNERFYDGELQQCGDPQVIGAFLGSPLLASKNFPIVFHAISGKDNREASSPSFFNIDEITQIKTYVQALLADKRYCIVSEDIGVIAPYSAQCRKIRQSLKAVAGSVKVGSVEEFQGQERTVVIISTVRSSREFVQHDLKHMLGFVANSRRFNVAVTRAKALLIIVGDPAVLSLDPLWRSFLNYVHLNNGWRGPPPHWDTGAPVMEGSYDRELREAGLADMNDFTRRMEAITLTDIDSDEVSTDSVLNFT